MGLRPPPRIARLPPALANQIAAGEVVERPASIVKELVENSLDAGARRIAIDVCRGGLEAVRVSDDGHGIHAEDVALALERHATSKVRSQSDLDGIATLGFRGEALPSIASVAALRLCSRRAGAAHAVEVESGPGLDARPARPASHPVGTTVEVRGLFHALPGRRKFLRSERTEYLHVLEVVQRLALSRPEVAFAFHHDGAEVLQCPAVAAGGERAAAVLGRGFQRGAIEVDYAVGGMHLRGWVGGAGQTRSQSDRQYFFLNGRTVRDRLVSHAVRTGLDEWIPAGRFPVYVLYFDLDARAADVNVHPTKHEVRFRNARDVHDFLCAALRSVSGGRTADAGADSGRGYAARLRDPRAPSAVPAAAAWRVAEPSSAPALGRPVADLGGDFLLSERDSRWLLIDLRAVRRLVAEARLARQRARGEISRRPLLVPVEIDALPADEAVLESRTDLLSRCGWRFEAVAPGRIAIREFPAALPDVDVKSLALDMLRHLRQTPPSAADPDRGLVELMARHAGAAPWSGEAAALLSALGELDLDLAAEAYPGLWRTLDPAELERLLRAG